MLTKYSILQETHGERSGEEEDEEDEDEEEEVKIKGESKTPRCRVFHDNSNIYCSDTL